MQELHSAQEHNLPDFTCLSDFSHKESAAQRYLSLTPSLLLPHPKTTGRARRKLGQMCLLLNASPSSSQLQRASEY